MFYNKCVEHTKSSIAKGGKKSTHPRCSVPIPKRLFLVLYKEKVVLVGNSQRDLTGYTYFRLNVHSTGFVGAIYLFYKIILDNVLKYNLI